MRRSMRWVVAVHAGLVLACGVADAQTVMFCALESATAAPNSEVEVYVFVQNAPAIRGYQSRISITPLTGMGTVAVECPSGVADPNVRVETDRPDYLFAANPGAFTVTNCTTRTAAAALLSGGIPVSGTPAYLSTYVLKVSSDAQGGSTFAISVLPHPGSALSDPTGAALPFSQGPDCILTVQAPDTLTLTEQFCSKCVRHPGSVTVSLDASMLSDPINGVQALFSYDPLFLNLTGVSPGDGQGSPWDAGMIVHAEDDGGDITFAIALNGSQTQADATVATFQFNTVQQGETDLTFREAGMPFATKLTTSLSQTVLPTKVDTGPILIGDLSKGDMNGDGSKDGLDVQAFVDLLLSPGTATASELCAGELSGDNMVTVEDDLNLFVDCLVADLCVCP